MSYELWLKNNQLYMATNINRIVSILKNSLNQKDSVKTKTNEQDQKNHKKLIQKGVFNYETVTYENNNHNNNNNDKKYETNVLDSNKPPAVNGVTLDQTPKQKNISKVEDDKPLYSLDILCKLFGLSEFE